MVKKYKKIPYVVGLLIETPALMGPGHRRSWYTPLRALAAARQSLVKRALFIIHHKNGRKQIYGNFILRAKQT